MPSIPFIILSFLLALLPSIFWAAIYLWEDRKEPEPRRILIRLFVAGMLTALASIILQEPIRQATAGTFGMREFLVIAFIEKGTMLVAAMSLVWHAKDFSQILDGVIYLVAVALGFSFVENFLFFAYWVPSHAGTVELGSALARVSLIRFLLTTFVHTLTAGISGLALGAARFTTGAARWPIIIVGLAAAVVLHAVFDAAVLSGYLSEAATATAVLGLLFLILLQLRALTRQRA